MTAFARLLGFFCLIDAVAGAAAPPSQEMPRHHVETITSARHEYRLHMDGAIDGYNTRDPIVYSAWKQGFEPMRFVSIENIGDSNIVNPWIVVNGKRNWRTAQDIADEAMRTYGDPSKMTPADKARAIYEFQRTHRFHATTGDFEVRDPVKMFNVYGYALCGDNAPVLMDLWRLAGLQTRRGFASGHCVSEAWYGGAWHMLDADESGVFLERDNATVAGDVQLSHDHDLVKRAVHDQSTAALYVYDGSRSGQYPSHVSHTMALTLRPGEALEWRWSHEGKHHHAADSLYTMRNTNLREHWGETAWARLANGKWIYQPPLRSPAARNGVTAQNVRWPAKASDSGIAPLKPGEPASLVWKMEAPYVIVGGTLRAKLSSKAGASWAFLISDDGKNWQPIIRSDRPVQGEITASLDDFFPNEGPARYRYFLRAELVAAPAAGSISLNSVVIENTLQMAPLSLPALELGDNTIVYSDESAGPRAVRVTFDWVERSDLRPPDRPAGAIFPADGSEVEGTQLTFRWEAAKASDGDGISEYHFQLGDEPGIRWALSSSFDVVVSSAETAVSRLGLLNPGKRYYWHVRARSDKGVWGPWSQVWSFTPQGPGVPLNLALERTGAEGFALVWNPNPGGRRPAKYLIYASNEKGFTVSDQAYEVYVGNQKDRGLFPGRKTEVFPSNLIATSQEPRLSLVPVHAFYRVVAVDEKGNRSGPSDYASAPRPLIYSRPVTEVRAGEPYRYEVKTISSIGDLTYRNFPGLSYQAAFWDADKPRFMLVDEISRCGNNDPAWLHLDPVTGVLSGKPGPDDIGEYQINVKVETPGAGVDLQSFPLRVIR
jgi:hypothetical protein